MFDLKYTEEIVIFTVVVVLQGLWKILYDKILVDLVIKDEGIDFYTYSFAFGKSEEFHAWSELVDISCTSDELKMVLEGTNGPYPVRISIRAEVWDDLYVKLNTLKRHWEIIVSHSSISETN
ncbi:hypothetical protein GCM10011318_18020 [Phaeocystidibacter marisrubri]|nr:hypothetical protein GCM10011318_18020 [Phaeocystidibacter marisrubri]